MAAAPTRCARSAHRYARLPRGRSSLAQPAWLYPAADAALLGGLPPVLFAHSASGSRPRPAAACCVRSGAARPPPSPHAAAPGSKAAARVRAVALRGRQRPGSPRPRPSAAAGSLIGRPCCLRACPGSLPGSPGPPAALRGAGGFQPRGRRRPLGRLSLPSAPGLCPRAVALRGRVRASAGALRCWRRSLRPAVASRC